MILQAIFYGLFNLFFAIIGIALIPLQAIVETAFPNIDGAIAGVDSFLTYITSALDFAFSWTMLSNACIQLIILYFTFTLTVPLLIYPFKMIVQWYRSLKP